MQAPCPVELMKDQTSTDEHAHLLVPKTGPLLNLTVRQLRHIFPMMTLVEELQVDLQLPIPLLLANQVKFGLHTQTVLLHAIPVLLLIIEQSIQVLPEDIEEIGLQMHT
jgi:hypothetical protein